MLITRIAVEGGITEPKHLVLYGSEDLCEHVIEQISRGNTPDEIVEDLYYHLTNPIPNYNAPV